LWEKMGGDNATIVNEPRKERGGPSSQTLRTCTGGEGGGMPVFRKRGATGGGRLGVGENVCSERCVFTYHSGNRVVREARNSS